MSQTLPVALAVASIKRLYGPLPPVSTLCFKHQPAGLLPQGIEPGQRLRRGRRDARTETRYGDESSATPL